MLALILGGLTLSQATMGVGAIGAACFWLILARLAQAERDTKRIIEALNRQTPPMPSVKGDPAAAAGLGIQTKW